MALWSNLFFGPWVSFGVTVHDTMGRQVTIGPFGSCGCQKAFNLALIS
ncbi:unnamed protein product [Nyctereutes procyonoides]|uniref:(raccoon dog) hypothetical protein n=1 Tax=Nyctereutes procyonoides TaxID=34880 RepID=A0A811YUD0_NYCPR|nr:unnamed protein product [Nyctereutes procyonoides]